MKGTDSQAFNHKTLAQLEEELHPKGMKVDKSDLVGVDLLIQGYEPWEGESGEAVYVTAVRLDTGELVSFNAGAPVLKTLRKYATELPFVAQVKQIETKKGRNPWILE